ncbi:hypothetical protein [uncultured Clostridium sp.]|uniref:hypothetical protein n=1 Tax=uncultured Clostridium sp. TaxID=59620 RepID=UPI002607B5CF|nr:hypothetical protein [uncultured Clostridium sp.]
MANRLQIIIEFSRYEVEEVAAYAKLKELSSPGALIKDALMGKIPFEMLRAITKGTAEE